MRWLTGRTAYGIGLIAGLVIIAASVLWAASPQQTANNKTQNNGNAVPSPVHEITLPQVPIEMPPGPNLQAFEQHCLLCHTGRYVTMQPRFSRAVWEKEVKKMADAYGAPITPAEQQQIVEYLVAIKGPAESK